VCYVREHLHVVSIARRVMEQTEHVMLAGDGADTFAREQGFEPIDLLTEEARKQYDERRTRRTHDTIGVLAIDADGLLAGACSTSGKDLKLPGRVGDSPIIGHGLYVDPDVGAAVATGNGELITGLCATFLAVELMRGGAEPVDALREVLDRAVRAYDLADKEQIGLIALRPDGRWAGAALRPDFVTAKDAELVKPEHVVFPA
jgi:isoaspartyl peptidase/L-asparaginase-like protein (Ntn-hydrolase superfamily)